MGVGDVLDHAMCRGRWLPRAAWPTGACAAIRAFTPMSGRGQGADAGRTGRGAVDPPYG
ncbi:hypothetical protein [Streptomyces sp. WAC04114]|uniref:hypothetical protein n=1 Tax=Streptomyces sp. WAC04114 TaxID=2867961 RepID=UPI001C8CC51A|nr:hypothetical protein [Streptomyces sp. WAC04114]MBX9360655.1 hypothetical protein [Streptomyces sp. WAC04114]